MKLVEWCETQISNEDYGVFEIDEEVLTNLNESEVKYQALFTGVYCRSS